MRVPEALGSTAASGAEASGVAGTVVKALESTWQSLLALMERNLPASAWDSPALLSSVAGCLEDALSHPSPAVSQPSLRFWDSTFGVALAAAQAAPQPVAPKGVPAGSKKASPLGSRHAPASLAGHRQAGASPGSRHLASSPGGFRRGREGSTPSPKSAGLKVPEQLTRSVEAARSRAAAESSEDKAEGGDAPMECPPCKLEEAFSVEAVGAPAGADGPATAAQVSEPTGAVEEETSAGSMESGPADMEGVEHESQQVPSAGVTSTHEAQVLQDPAQEELQSPSPLHAEGTSQAVGVPGLPVPIVDASGADASAAPIAAPTEQQVPALTEPVQPAPPSAAACAEQSETVERGSEGFSFLHVDTPEQAVGAPVLPSPTRAGGAGSMPSPARQGAPTARQPSPFRTTPTGKPRKLSSVSNRLSRLLSGSPESRSSLSSSAPGTGASVPGYMKPVSPRPAPGARSGAPSASPFRPASPAGGARGSTAAARGTFGTQGSSAASSRGASPARGAKSPVKTLPSPPRRSSAAVAAEPRPAVSRSTSGEAPGVEPRATAAAPSYTPRTLSHSMSCEMPTGDALEPSSGGLEAEEILAQLGKSMDMSQSPLFTPGAPAAATTPASEFRSAEGTPSVPPVSARLAPSPHRPSASRLRSLASGFKNLLVSSQGGPAGQARPPSPSRHSPYGHTATAPAHARAPSPRMATPRAASPAPTPARGVSTVAPGGASSPASRASSGPISLAGRGRRPSPARHVSSTAGPEAAADATSTASAGPGAAMAPVAGEEPLVSAGQQAQEMPAQVPPAAQRSGLFSLRTRGGDGSRGGGSSFGRRDVERGREGAAAARPASPAFRGGPLKVSKEPHRVPAALGAATPNRTEPKREHNR